jgi:two-component system sensor histidine kinase BaeS
VLVRLLAMSLAIAACSIGATAWIAATNTSDAIREQYSEDLSAGARIYDGVLGYAADHPTWAGVNTVADKLAAETGRQVVITTVTGELIYSSTGASSRPPSGAPAAVVNPLAVSAFPGLTTTGGIDPRAVGPFRLTDNEAATVRSSAQDTVRCLTALGVRASTRVLPSGRTIVDYGDGSSNIVATRAPAADGQKITTPPRTASWSKCLSLLPDTLTKSEQLASKALSDLIGDCADRQGLSFYAAALRTGDINIDVTTDTLITPANQAIKGCVDTARREQLSSYVAPPALLYLTGFITTAPHNGLSGDTERRIVLTALVILLVAVGAAAIAASPLVRPLHALTVAAQRVGAGDRTARVDTRDSGQIGALAAAFNGMARELEVAERQRKQLVSDVAHELRTPLGNIRGWLEATQDGVATFDASLSQSLLDESMLLQHVIDDLQDLALAEAGELVFHPEPLDAAAVVRQVGAAHLAKADAAGVKITVDCPRPVQLTADVSRLRQALGNLVTNAVRYTPAGGRVSIRAERIGDMVTIEVSDTGIGIRAQDLPHVFDRFWRAEQSRSRRSGGSGLGLAITRHLVEAQGGTISVHSEPDAGSVFTITLPATE